MSTLAIVFILLDATRADRFGAWGNPRRTTPHLDGLAARGIVFRRHYANAHATRSSFPQLMSGRYFHQNVLRSFMPNDHPREYPFSRPDPRSALLPDVLRRDGYQTLGVSAHPWVVADSELGRGFDELEFVDAEPSRGHADAPDVVDRAIDLWQRRDRSRPLFLYVHLMDMHMPRFPPEREPRFPVPGFAWRERFADGGDPKFNRHLRQWSQFEAGDFTDTDRRHFVAAYDTRLAYADEHLGRLLAALRAHDPDLDRTLVVVTADHGEELAEDGRIGHSGSLAEGIQHVPLIMAGGGIRPGQAAERFTEHVDLAPTILTVARAAAPPGMRTHGRAQLTADGVLAADYGKPAVYYVWEEYRAVRSARHLLRQQIPGSLLARCNGDETLYRLTGATREVLDVGTYAALAERLRARLARRLDRLQQEFAVRRYGTPITGFVVRPAFWRLGTLEPLDCLPLDAAIEGRRVRARGWLWSGRGVTVLRRNGGAPLSLRLAAPDGDYHVDATTVPMTPAPWLFGYARWLRRSFLRSTPAEHVPLGTFRSDGGELRVDVPASVALGRHIVGIRLVPPGAAADAAPADEDAELHRRLEALGYVE